MSDWKYEEDEVLTPSEVAEIFKVDPKTVTRWANKGKFPDLDGRATVIRTPGGHTRIRAQVLRMIVEGKLTIDWGDDAYSEPARPEGTLR